MNTQLARSEFRMLYLTVMNIELKTNYLKMLQKMVDIENQLIGYLPKMAENAENPVLYDAIEKHTRQITIQRDRLRRILMKYHVPVGNEYNEVFAKFLRDMERDMLRITEPEVRDAFIISTAQMIKHIRISKYNTLAEWADFLKERDDEDLLGATLSEEDLIAENFSALAETRMHTVSDLRDLVEIK